MSVPESASEGILKMATRQLDRSGLGVLTVEECIDRLRTARVGRLAFFDQGEPMILPVSHGMDGNAVVFRTAPGSKLLIAENEMPVAFEADGIDADRRAGWSVVVRGTARTVEARADIARLALLGVWPWADMAERSHWIRISPKSVTGRVVIHPAW